MQRRSAAGEGRDGGAGAVAGDGGGVERFAGGGIGETGGGGFFAGGRGPGRGEGAWGGTDGTVGFSDEMDSVFKVVEHMPEYPGGVQELLNYIGSNIKYPEEAKRDSVQGRVFVSFVIEKDGRVSSAKILRGIGSGCDKESLRVVQSMPNWSPGKDENGKPVRVAYNLPIKYALN